MKPLSFPRSLSLLCLLATFTLLSGCAANLAMPDTVITPTDAGTGDLHGNVYGGRQPIQGAHIYLYGAANTGYGAAGISLLGNTTGTAVCTPPLAADPSGNCYYTTSTGTGTSSNPGGEFNLSNLYKCNVTASGAAQPNQQVWLFSTGGSPGVVNPDGSGGTTISNPAATLTAALGTCPSSGNFSTAGNGALSYIYMNEVSTVAFAYAVAGFAGTQTNGAQFVGGPTNTYTPNLKNAFANAKQLYDIQGGADPGDHGARHLTPGGNGGVPFLLINTIADAMSTCINSNNVSNSSPSSACQAFFQAIYGTASYPSAAETASAAIYLAKHQGESSATQVFSVAPSESPWLPDYASAAVGTPSDATAAINFTGLNGAYGIVIDSTGNAYVTEKGSSGYIVKLPNSGAPTFSSVTLNSPSGITIDSSGNVWTPGKGTSAGVLYEFTSSLTPVTGSPYSYTPSLTNSALQIAADTSGYVYIADYGNSQVVQVNNTSPTTPAYLQNRTTCTNAVEGIAYNNSATFPGTLWVTGSGTNKDVCDIPKPGSGSSTPNASGAIGTPGQYIAVDSGGNAYVTAGNSSIYKVSTGSTVATISNSSSLVSAGPVAIDGANNIWVINNPTATNSTGNVDASLAPSIAEYCTACTPRPGFLSPAPATGTATGFQYGLLNAPQGIAIDGSGDVWVTNTGSSQVTELIGVAVPLTTPIAGGTGLPNVRTDTDEPIQ
jgi:hypothetical protein